MNNLKNLKKNITTFLVITWSFLLPSLLILLFYDSFANGDSSYSAGDIKFYICCIFLLPPFTIFSVFLCIDLYLIKKDLKKQITNREVFTITKISHRHSFLMYDGVNDKRLNYQTETYIYLWVDTLDKKNMKIRVFPNVFDSKANICGRKYEIEYYKNSKVATKMTRIK